MDFASKHMTVGLYTDANTSSSKLEINFAEYCDKYKLQKKWIYGKSLLNPSFVLDFSFKSFQIYKDPMLVKVDVHAQYSYTCSIFLKCFVPKVKFIFSVIILCVFTKSKT